MRYEVNFIQNWVYEVDAVDEHEAEEKAYREFSNQMSYPVAHTNYDDITIELLDDEEYIDTEE